MSVVVKSEKIFIAKEWLVVAVMTFMMVVAWISVSVYQVLSKSGIAPAQAERLKGFSPVLDEVALQDLGSRKQLLDLSSVAAPKPTEPAEKVQ
ncbi:hypothetical protein HYU89_02380 [Candidatus Collierbacteria bacterium]|nr:hypothetical protein [Candidatus Collierbacteria bacterium]